MDIQNYIRIQEYIYRMKLLIVEDNIELSSNIKTYLVNEGMICEVAHNQFEAFDKTAAYKYDIVIIDIMLPDGSGLNILKQLKNNKVDSGIIIITAKNAIEDKIKGLELGADDYITKPFHLSELNARIKTLYRRLKFDGNKDIVFNEIVINPFEFSVKVSNKPITLTRKQYELLVYFIANKNLLLTKQSVAEHLWGDYVDSYDNFDFVYQHIKNLRKKLISAGGNDYIQTIYGLGYKFSSQ